MFGRATACLRIAHTTVISPAARAPLGSPLVGFNRYRRFRPSRMANVRSIAAALAVLALVAAGSASAAPDAELWSRWLAHRPGAAETVDHDAWDRFLSRHVVAGADGIARIAYGRVGAEDRRLLDGYVAGLAMVPVGSLDRPQQRAFWINLYNALTVQLVLQHYPVDSIRDIDISPGLFADGPWGKPLVLIAGEPLSLDDIEHRILRPIWRDPRVHYALNCASIGCPDIQGRAFTPDNTEVLLESAARAFVNHPRGARIADGDLVVSSIYAWFADDFGGDDATVIAHLRRYADGPLSAALAGRRHIDGDAYDWALNDAAP